MHKLRKNSLSPCYSSNKQNIIIDNMVTPDTNISFRNLEKFRKQNNLISSNYAIPTNEHNKDIRQSQRVNRNLDYCSSSKDIYSNSAVHNSQSTRQCVSPYGIAVKAADHHRNKKDRSVQEYRSSLKSKQKQMGSLQCQVKCLNETISLLKQQVGSLRTQNSILSQEKQQLKQKLTTTQQNLQNTKKGKAVNCNYSDYETIMGKLSELEDIQEQLLVENQKLKEKQSLQSAVLKNVKILLKMQGDQHLKIDKVLTLVGAYTL